MTLRNILEIVNRSYPTVGVNEIVIRANAHQKFFCQQTRCLRGSASSLMQSTDVVVEVPERVYLLRRVRLLDADENGIEVGEYYWKYLDRKVYFVGSDGEMKTTMPADAENVEFNGILISNDLQNETSVPEIDSSLQPYLLHAILSDLHAESGNLQAASVQSMSMNRYVREGIKMGAKAWDETPPGGFPPIFGVLGFTRNVATNLLPGTVSRYDRA